MIPHDDHVRVWRIATDPDFVAAFMARMVIRQSAYRWKRMQWRETHPDVPVSEPRLLTSYEIRRRAANGPS